MSGSGDITVWINSPGGDCVAAAQIYNMLMDYKGNVTVKIDGIAASAASKTALRKLVQYLMSKYKIPANKVLRHYDLTGKRCPAYYADETRWAALHEYITAPEVNPRTLYSTYAYLNQILSV